MDSLTTRLSQLPKDNLRSPNKTWCNEIWEKRHSISHIKKKYLKLNLMWFRWMFWRHNLRNPQNKNLLVSATSPNNVTQGKINNIEDLNPPPPSAGENASSKLSYFLFSRPVVQSNHAGKTPLATKVVFPRHTVSTTWRGLSGVPRVTSHLGRPMSDNGWCTTPRYIEFVG